MRETKICLCCEKSFSKPMGCGKKVWKRRTFCSQSCSQKYRVGTNCSYWKERIRKECLYCKKEFYVVPSENDRKFCTQKCYGKYEKETWDKKIDFHPRWINGKIRLVAGYIVAFAPDHPRVTKTCRHILEHRLVMERHLGRYLTSEEAVHHLNGKKDDNRIENLKLFDSRSAHQKYHQALKRLALKF